MSEQLEITDIVFDFCGVLIDWQCRAALDHVVDSALVDCICADDDPYGFFRYEAAMDGGVLLNDILPVVEQEQGAEIATIFAYYIHHYGDALPQLIPGMLPLLEELNNKGLRLWGLTNWSSETFPLAFERFPQLAALLTDTVVSGVEQMHKPQAQIYELAQSRFGLNPAHTLFFDDTHKNVLGARAVGWHALDFTTADQARHDLRELQIL